MSSVIKPVDFAGSAFPAKPSDVQVAASTIGCTVATLTAVRTVETASMGGFLPDGSGRPVILFEAQHFSAATEGVYDATHPAISSAHWNAGLYRGGSAEYDRLGEAITLNRQAALISTSWGLFQILASNFSACGYTTAEDFVEGMAVGESLQLLAFAQFVVKTGLSRALIARDWSGFAARYNGPSYRADGYVQKLEAAYAAACGLNQPLRDIMIGSTGAPVKRLQAALVSRGYSLVVDGMFGLGTQLILRRFQAESGLATDGVAGPSTIAALDLPST